MRKFLPLFLIVFVTVGTLLGRDYANVFFKNQEFASSPAKNELSSHSYVERILLSDGKVEANAQEGVWFNKRVKFQTTDLARLISTTPANVLGDTSEEKWIEIDLSTQRLFAHEGSRTIYSFPVSSGLPWLPTVTGEFRIWSKIIAQRMTGGSRSDGTYYDLPNVPFVQYFYKGYGIHGAYWHHDFGHPRSHGCVNMDPNDAKTLFYWTNPPLAEGRGGIFDIQPAESTKVVVHGTTPLSLN